MSGHSKWATTKHKKAAIDAKRGKLFARLIKRISRLQRALVGQIQQVTQLCMMPSRRRRRTPFPADNIDRALKRGSGEGDDGVSYENIQYEEYAAGGVARADRVPNG